MPRFTAELYIAGLTYAGGALFVIQQRSMYKLINSTGTRYDTANVTGMYKLVKVPQSTQHGQARQSGEPHGAALCRAIAAVRC